MSALSPQDLYAHTLQLQRLGYPLRCPEPTWDISAPTADAMDGLQIGDVGYIDYHGKFNVLFNTYFPLPDKLRQEGFPPYQPTSLDSLNSYLKYYTNTLRKKTVFVRGMKRTFTQDKTDGDQPRATYKFTTTANRGAILTVPSGATYHALPDRGELEELEDLAQRHAREWCNHAGCESLFMITGMYKAKSWALGSFHHAQVGEEISVRRRDDGTWDLECSFDVDFRSGPRYNEEDYENQTILIQGFEMPVDQWREVSRVPMPRRIAEVFCIRLSSYHSSSSDDLELPPSPSPDPRTSRIREIVKETIRDMPHVLIDTASGRLCDQEEQAAALERLPVFNQLRSSEATHLNGARIRAEVKEFYRYAMISHKWQLREPTFQTLQDSSVYKLPKLPSFNKLRKFCRLARTLQFRWAWCDTCCIDLRDRAMQQESIVAMFRWYRASSLTVVHLVGVISKSQMEGSLRESVWNTRGWTYQEYLASDVVQFYTEDWKPYLDLKLSNHKESPIILSEMEQAVEFTQEKLATLRPGIDKARDKLFLASKRQTTRGEDIAYSLFGIFNVALPVIYGEGKPVAIGRLLEHVLSRSGDVSLLAWTGTSGTHHSYLPSDITVYQDSLPPHIPEPIPTAQMDGLVSVMRTPDSLAHVQRLYKELFDLPSPSLTAGRLRLSTIVFPLENLARISPPQGSDDTVPVYQGTSPMLGVVEIQTRDSLSEVMDSILIHPWIGPLLDEDYASGRPLYDEATRALQLAVRLTQSFGALLLAPSARALYRRAATDALIVVQVQEGTTPDVLMSGIRTVEVQ